MVLEEVSLVAGLVISFALISLGIVLWAWPAGLARLYVWIDDRLGRTDAVKRRSERIGLITVRASAGASLILGILTLIATINTAMY